MVNMNKPSETAGSLLSKTRLSKSDRDKLLYFPLLKSPLAPLFQRGELVPIKAEENKSGQDLALKTDL
jgi:hypothetical protein